MVDRLGHLYFLERTNSFEEFEDWSFCRQMDANNNSLSDLNFKDRLDKDYFLPTEENKERYKRIKNIGKKWKRPDIEEEFKIKKLYFLYKFGYDYASTHVHPMSNDGMIEYFRMIRNPPENIVKHFDHQTQLIIQNSSLISSLTVNECLNFSSFKWRAPVFKFIESFRLAINDEVNELELNFLKMRKFIEENLPLGISEG